jgi:hypothetical protein
MANGLTDSDLNRQRLGFGVAPDTASRRRAVEAGVSPLTTGERIRRDWGWGPSTPEEQKAFQAAEVIERGGPVEQMPVEYGGRPTGTSRRALRMQEEWDKRQQQQLINQRMIQQLDLEQKAESRMQRAQDLEFEKYRLNEDRESRVLDEAGAIVDSIRGEVAPDGTIISNPIRPEDDDAVERLEGLGRFKFGMENKSALEMWSALYNDALKFREEKIKQNEQNQLAAANLSARTGKPMREFGEYDERGIFKPNLNAIAKTNEELKQKEEAAAEEKEVIKETRRAEARETVAEKKSKETQIIGIDKDLRREELSLEEVAANLGLQRDRSGRFNIGGLSDSQKKTFRAAENRVRLLEQDRAQLQGFMFDTEADAQAAIEAKTVPKGAIIFINGKKAINR